MTERRDFIKKSLIGSAALAIGGMGFSTKSYASIMGSNERINVAVIGIRNMGSVHVNAFCNLKDTHNVRLKTLCDVDESLFERQSQVVATKTGLKPHLEWDMRKVFDDKEIDAVSIVVPNHWHALATVWACQAGKHVYVEKPAMHTMWEGKKMIEAAEKYNRRVQVGFNNRSISNIREAIDFLHGGGIGDVYMARGLGFRARDSYGMASDSQPPKSLHYDLWLGPAPYRPYNEKRGHYNWHWFWDTGNGDIGNTGTHQLDIARWGMNKNEHPVSIYSAGGIFGLDQELRSQKTPGVMTYGDVETYGHDKSFQETPNTQTSIMRYADGKILEFEVRNRYTNSESSLNVGVGNLFYGTEGYLELGGENWKAFRRRETEPFAASKGKSKQAGSFHWANFIEAVRAGKDDGLYSPISDGYLSSSLPLLSNISYRLDRQLNFIGDKERFNNDQEANGMLTKKYRNPYEFPKQV